MTAVIQQPRPLCLQWTRKRPVWTVNK